MAAPKPAVSFIGLGAMGFGMATHLIAEGYPVTGFDVWGPTLERFKQAGGSIASTPAEAARDKAFCVCMVATAQQAQAVLWQGDHPAAPALPQGATLLICSTVPCAYIQGLAKELADRGRQDIHLVDSPVSGGAIRAADGTLSIMAGGSDEAMEKGNELLQAMSDPQKLYLVKGGVGAGSNMKMCHQVLAANHILSASEALGFAAHLGLNPKTISTEIIQSGGYSWMFENRLPRLLAPDFKPVASAVTIILKDAGIITSESRRCDFPTPMTNVAEQVYLAALARGWGADDDACLLRLYSEGVGKVGAVAGLASSEKEKTSLVVSLLEGIHLCSAAEAIAFASHVGLDLDQMFDLCINAAGGSSMLEKFGREIIEALRAGDGEAKGWTTEPKDGGLLSLGDVVGRLQAAVDEAQRLKTPIFLGIQALSMSQLALRGVSAKYSASSVVKTWIAK